MVNVSGAGGGAHTLDGSDHSDIPAITEAQGMIIYRDGSGAWVALSVGTSGQFLKTNGVAQNPSWDTPAGGGDVSGPTADVLDNAIARWNGTSGGALQNSPILIDDSGNITLVTSISIDNAGLHLVHAGTTNFDLIVNPSSTLTADRTLSIATGDADRTLTISGNAELDQDVHAAASPSFVGVTIDNTGLHILHAGTTTFDLIIKPGSVLGADRTLTLTTGDADRTLTISANVTLDQSLGIGENVAFGTLTVEALHINQGTTAFDLIVAPGSVLTADRTLTFTTGDADRTLTINGNVVMPGDTLAGLATGQTFTAANIFDGASASLEVPNAAGGRTVDADGEVTVDSTPTYGHFKFFATQENALSPLQPLSVVLELPTSTEDIPLGFFDEAITIRQINDVVVGTTPSLTWNIYHATTKDSTAPNTVFTSDRVTTSESGAESLPADTNRNDDTIPAGSWVWFESSAESGTTSWFVATISITVDP